jgi:hypothetical protein
VTCWLLSLTRFSGEGLGLLFWQTVMRSVVIFVSAVALSAAVVAWMARDVPIDNSGLSAPSAGSGPISGLGDSPNGFQSEDAAGLEHIGGVEMQRDNGVSASGLTPPVSLQAASPSQAIPERSLAESRPDTKRVLPPQRTSSIDAASSGTLLRSATIANPELADVSPTLIAETIPAGIPELSVPRGAQLPALFHDDRPLPAPQRRALDRLANEFIDAVSSAPVGNDEVAVWNEARAVADRRYITLFGHAAFNALHLQAAKEAVQEKRALSANQTLP